jgi:ethanolamine utilization protein EutA (predicted chaperonin)
LSDERLLPLGDLVILGSVSPDTLPDELDRLFALAARTANGACLRIDAGPGDRASIRGLAERIHTAMARQTAVQHIPLVLLVRENIGKVVGQLITQWGRSPAKVIVVDEIDSRDAQFACIGRLQQGVLPVSFYGMSAK